MCVCVCVCIEGATEIPPTFQTVTCVVRVYLITGHGSSLYLMSYHFFSDTIRSIMNGTDVLRVFVVEMFFKTGESVIVTQSAFHDLSCYVWMILFTKPSARAGYDTRSIFKRSLTGLNSEFSFS